ncbi:MAG: ATP-dependent RecD-like DNA helicase, partial [Oscillospiraceae bacterium]
IGQIVSVEAHGGGLTVDFEGRTAEYAGEQLNELETAYAVTVHKAQGSEYRAVVLAASDAPSMLLTRGVLYTAITRARELLVVVGDDEVLARMAKNDRQTKRYSGLCARLTE